MTEKTVFDLPAHAQESLAETHAMYSAHAQRERADTLFMAENGHPNAAAYQSLNSFFQSLRYACNSGARFFSYQNSDECSEYWRPDLKVSWSPLGPLSHFGHVYPALGERWKEYLQAAADVGWEGATPWLDGGQWLVSTHRDDLVAELKSICAETSTQIRVNQTRLNGPFRLTICYGADVAMLTSAHARITDALKKHHPGYVIPPRTGDDDAKDNAERPLAQKAFALGNVKELTVGPLQVLVPLMPLSGSMELLVDTVSKIEALLAQGYPFAQVESWLKKFLKPTAFKKLQAKYAPAA